MTTPQPPRQFKKRDPAEAAQTAAGGPTEQAPLAPQPPEPPSLPDRPLAHGVSPSAPNLAVPEGAPPGEGEEELSPEKIIENQKETIATLLQNQQNLIDRIRRAVSAAQTSQSLVIELSRGSESTMSPPPSHQQVIDILYNVIVENWKLVHQQ